MLGYCVGFDATCSESTTLVTLGTAVATATAFDFTPAESTCPERVTTPFVLFTDTFATVDTPTSDTSFAFTWAEIFMSSTWASGDSFVRQPTIRASKAIGNTILIMRCPSSIWRHPVPRLTLLFFDAAKAPEAAKTVTAGKTSPPCLLA
jgi:hypothetical protein